MPTRNISLTPEQDAFVEEVVRSVLEIEQRHTGVYQLDDEERADLLQALDEVRRGDVADDDEAAALFKRLTA